MRGVREELFPNPSCSAEAWLACGGMPVCAFLPVPVEWGKEVTLENTVPRASLLPVTASLSTHVPLRSRWQISSCNNSWLWILEA